MAEMQQAGAAAKPVFESLGDIERMAGAEGKGASQRGMDNLTRSHLRNLRSLDNIIRNNLKKHDFIGVQKELRGIKIPKPGGGSWDHIQEMKGSLKGLEKIKRGLEGSLKNPHISQEVMSTIKAALEKTYYYIKKINDTGI